jgi:fibronectin type 3 domain-containing protein
MAAFAFGFGSQKVLELAREFPRSSTSENIPPSQVTGLQVVLNAGPPRQMDLTWTANLETDLHHYNIYRGDQANFTVNLSTPDFTSQTNTYSDSSVNAGQTYYYRIAAVNTSKTIGQLSVEGSS